MPSASDGVLAGRQFSTGAPPCNPNRDCFFDVISRVRESFRAGGTSLTLFHLLPPRDIRPLLIGSNEPVTTGSGFYRKYAL
jgi:hypothetical protein